MKINHLYTKLIQRILLVKLKKFMYCNKNNEHQHQQKFLFLFILKWEEINLFLEYCKLHHFGLV